jgi:hypothetical protein
VLFYYFAGRVPLTFLTFPGMEPGLKGVMRGGAGAFFADYSKRQKFLPIDVWH